jgi:hypothetical protein
MNNLILLSCIYDVYTNSWLEIDVVMHFMSIYLHFMHFHMGFIKVTKVHYEPNMIDFLTKLLHYVLVIEYIVYMNPGPSFAHINRNL